MSKAAAVEQIRAALNEAERNEAEAKRLGQDDLFGWWSARAGGLRYALNLLID